MTQLANYDEDDSDSDANDSENLSCRALMHFFQYELGVMCSRNCDQSGCSVSSTADKEEERQDAANDSCCCSDGNESDKASTKRITIVQDNAPASIPRELTDHAECRHNRMVISLNAYPSARRFLLEQQLLASCRWESFAKMDQKCLFSPPRRTYVCNEEYYQQQSNQEHYDADNNDCSCPEHHQPSSSFTEHHHHHHHEHGHQHSHDHHHSHDHDQDKCTTRRSTHVADAPRVPQRRLSPPRSPSLPDVMSADSLTSITSSGSQSSSPSSSPITTNSGRSPPKCRYDKDGRRSERKPRHSTARMA